MANYCDTQYAVTGPAEALEDLWNTLGRLDVNGGSIELDDFAIQYGIDPEDKDFHGSGTIYYADYDKDNGVLYFATETVGGACIDFSEELNHVFNDRLCVNYRVIELGSEYFVTHDPQGFFPEECLVSAEGNKTFGEDGYFDPMSFEEAITTWCEAMHIDRGGRSTEEMVALINDYVYDDDDGECVSYNIYPFEFV